MTSCSWRLGSLLATITVAYALVPAASNSSQRYPSNAAPQLVLASRLRLGPTQLHSPTGGQARPKVQPQLTGNIAFDPRSLVGQVQAPGQLTPLTSEARLNGAMNSWCATAFDHGSRYRVLALQRITASGTTAEEMQAEIIRLRNQKASIDLALAGDAVRQMEWAQSADAKQLMRAQVQTNKQYAAARATLVRWQISKERISSVDLVATRVCGEHTALHIAWNPSALPPHPAPPPAPPPLPPALRSASQPVTMAIKAVPARIPTNAARQANTAAVVPQPATLSYLEVRSRRGGRVPKAQRMAESVWPIDTIVDGVRNAFGSPSPSPSPSPHTSAQPMSEDEASNHAVKVARENLRNRRVRLEREIAECEGQRAALRTAQDARNNMFARTAMEKTAYEHAVDHIQDDLKDLADMCGDFVGDGEAFLKLSEEEKADYSAMSRGVNQKEDASFLDLMHGTWVNWRQSMDSVYGDLEERCKGIKDLLTVRLVSHQEQVDRLDASERTRQGGGQSPPAEPCPPAAELEAEIADVDKKLQEIEGWQ